MWVLLMAVALALPLGAAAQGGVFKRGGSNGERLGGKGMVQNRSGETTGNFTNEGFGYQLEGDDITNETFGVPLTSGILIMLATGAGYATIKTRKRNKKN